MNLRFIPSRVHGVLDYVNGAILLAAPELLRTKNEPRATLVSRVAAAGATVSTLMTNFELGVVKVVPMPVHLVVDALSGALLTGAPWLLGYARGGTRYWWPHAIVGAAEVLAAAATKTEPSYYKAKPELVDVFQGWLKGRGRSGWRRGGSSGGTYGGAVGLAVGALSAGTLILFLRRRTRRGAREEAEEAHGAARSGGEGYAWASRTEVEPSQAVKHRADQEEGAVKDKKGVPLKRLLRNASTPSGSSSSGSRRLDRSRGRGCLREAGGEQEAVRGDPRVGVKNPLGTERGHIGRSGRGGSEAHGARDSAGEQMTMVGVLAKMAEAFEETGGGRFVLPSEDEGNFDLRSK